MKMVHVTIRTGFFEEEIGFYQNVAGLKIVRDLREKGSDIVFLAEGDDGTKIEVIRMEDAYDSGNKNLSVGFQADDVEKLREDLLAKGLEAGPVISPAPAVKFFFVSDPAGVSVQFIEE